MKTKKIIIINGANLNLLGKRQPEIYGNQNFNDYFSELKQKFPSIELDFFQSNIEGEIINQIHQSEGIYDGIILNAGAYSHTSLAIADAISCIETPVIEVHISNTFAREKFRHHSYISAVASGIIIGFGLKSYQIAIESLI